MLMEHTTKFQPNKALSVYSTTRRLWETLKGENAGLSLDDCMSDACSSLPVLLTALFLLEMFLGMLLFQKHSPFLFSATAEKVFHFHPLFCTNHFPFFLPPHFSVRVSARCNLVSIQAVGCL